MVLNRHNQSNKRDRNITGEDIVAYLANKAYKKAKHIANKLTSSSENQQAFVWRKKIEHQVVTQRVSMDEFSVKAEKKRQKERLSEMEKLKKRREERDVQKARREEEMSMLARERARAEFQDWEKKEEEFEFQQCKAKSKIRICEGRPKPVDLLVMYNDGFSDYGVEPCKMLQGMLVKDLEELADDLKMYVSFEKGSSSRYWESVLVLCEWEIRKRKMVCQERGLHGSVEADVEEFLVGKGYGELEELQRLIEVQLQTGDAKVVEFWEAVGKRLPVYKSKAFLKDMHAKILLKRSGPSARTERLVECGYDKTEWSLEAEKEDSDENERSEGSYSPQLLHGDEDEDAVDPEEDNSILERRRVAVLDQQASREDDFEKNALKYVGAMKEGEVELGLKDEITVDSSKAYWWHDKYRPRKPKYFNRVHTGYAWNKYNQTHYDHDNPPPKMVQGYKFNIFYPDLVDKSKAPTYTIEKDGESTDTCIIRFHAGPPYEDIAFRIVSKEWEYSRKKGFKCTFERGILQLHFNLKYYRYRR